MNKKITRLAEIIEESKGIVFLGGAGVSTESGIPDFRSANGLYNKKLKSEYSPEEMLSHSFMMEHTEDFFNFYRKTHNLLKAKPNACHEALAKLEKIGKLKAIVTQNIDGLHQMAGSINVLELHGSIRQNYCATCNKVYPEEFIFGNKRIPVCDECGGIVRPDVVLYGENLDLEILKKAAEAIESVDTLIVGGTSLVVNPAASLVRHFRGRNLIIINKSETSADEWADLVIHDSIGKVMFEAVKSL